MRSIIVRRRIMAVSVLGILLVAALPLTVARGQQQPGPVARDAIILLDITASMRGCCGGRDIWDQVIAKVGEQVDQISDGTSFAIVPFAGGPIAAQIWPAAPPDLNAPLILTAMSPPIRQGAKAYLSGVNPNGQATYICTSLDYALGQLKSWQQRQGGTNRIQTLYLYTDGLDTGSCGGGDFSDRLIERFNAQATDYPYLRTVYIDLNDTFCTAQGQKIEQATNGGLRCTTDLPATFEIAEKTVALGNIYTPQNGAKQVTLHMKTPLPTDQEWVATVETQTNALGVKFGPAEVKLGPEFTVTVTAPPGLPNGDYSGVIRLHPKGNGYIFSNDGSVAVTFQYIQPTATPTMTATATATATATPTSTPTNTPTPTPTPTPSPTPSPRPTFTPTPRAIIAVKTDDGSNLGSVAAGSAGPPHASTLSVTYDKAAIEQNAGADLMATIDGKEDPTRFWLERPDGTRVTQLTVKPGQSAVTVGYLLDARREGSFMPGTKKVNADVSVMSPNAGVQLSRGGIATDKYGYTYDVVYPATKLIGVVLAALAALLLFAFLKMHPRFPRGAEIVAPGGFSDRLRTKAERGFAGKMTGGAVTVGGPGAAIDMNGTRTLAKITPGKSPFSFGDKGPYIQPLGKPDDTEMLKVDGEDLTKRVRLYPDSKLTLGREQRTYTEG